MARLSSVIAYCVVALPLAELDVTERGPEQPQLVGGRAGEPQLRRGAMARAPVPAASERALGHRRGGDGRAAIARTGDLQGQLPALGADDSGEQAGYEEPSFVGTVAGDPGGLAGGTAQAAGGVG